jgi:hypothetical protein
VGRSSVLLIAHDHRYELIIRPQSALGIYPSSQVGRIVVNLKRAPIERQSYIVLCEHKQSAQGAARHLFDIRTRDWVYYTRYGSRAGFESKFNWNCTAGSA